MYALEYASLLDMKRDVMRYQEWTRRKGVGGDSIWQECGIAYDDCGGMHRGRWVEGAMTKNKSTKCAIFSLYRPLDATMQKPKGGQE